jgi:hypothetical protein
MTNDTNTNTYTIPVQIVEEGRALGAAWRKAESAAARTLAKSTAKGGFDYRLGTLLATLRQQAAEHGQTRLSAQTLKEAGIADIDKRRRSEALWYHDNHEAVTSWLADSGKSFSSLTALQTAWKKAEKEAHKATPETDTDTDTDTETGTKKSRISDPAALATTLLQSASSRAIAKQAADLVLTMIREEQAARHAA